MLNRNNRKKNTNNNNNSPKIDHKYKKTTASKQRKLIKKNKTKLVIQYENTLADEKQNVQYKLFKIICFIVCNSFLFYFFLKLINLKKNKIKNIYIQQII